MRTSIRATVPTLTVVDGIPTTTSNEVAQHFGKRHDHIIDKIAALITDMPPDFSAPNFRAAEYIDEQGKRRASYRLTRDGFTLLAMGFTGYKALAFKLAYIEAFNHMERKLADGASQLPDPLRERRFLLTYFQGRESIRPIEADIALFKLSSLPSIIADPASDLTAQQLAQIAQAAVQRLAERCSNPIHI